MGLSVVILAAGKGKRMVSGLSKVLHPLGGVPLLEHVVKTAQSLNAGAIHVVYRNAIDSVRDSLGHLAVHWVAQDEPKGTGHAVLQAIPFCHDTDRVLVLYGDVPLISTQTLQTLLQDTPVDGLGLVFAKWLSPNGFGRIIRDSLGRIVRIVEHKDADPQQLHIREINTGIMTASGLNLKKWLPKLSNDNTQKEYYLTDVVALAAAENYSVNGVRASFRETQGVNDRWELAQLERYFQRSQAKKLALAGATLIDPNRLDIRGDDVHVSPDVVIDANVILEGKIRLGRNVRVGPYVRLKNVTVGDNSEILSHSVIENATIAPQCCIGPFARLRSGSILEEGAKVGNFVEMKKSTLGCGSKANHLTYLGDTTIGKNVNIGAGTITCNYDGANKWETHIQDGAFIGSNVALVAPVTIGKDATIGAGSTITQNAPPNRLTLARERQRTIEGWRRPAKKESESL